MIGDSLINWVPFILMCDKDDSILWQWFTDETMFLLEL